MKFTIKSNLFGLVILFGITFFLICITNRYILTINFYENSGDPVSGIPDQESRVYGNLQKWIYLSSAVYLLIKLLLISLVLYTALYLSDHYVNFEKIFNVTIWAESIFFIPAIIKIYWFHFHYPGGTLADWHKFYVLSALSLFDYGPADYYYALQTINVFEFCYWFILAYGISKISGLGYDRSLRLILYGYLPALFIWISVVTFCSVMIFPGTA
jgi:hypothetical protein